MKRVDPRAHDVDLENLIYHLARYKFVMRQLRGDEHILELGCGTGYGLKLLESSCARAIGIDEDGEAIAWAVESYSSSKLNYSLGSVDDDAIVDGSPYDVAICLEVIEHMSRSEALELLRKINGLLGVGGLAFISTPRFLPMERRSENRQLHHVHEYTYAEFDEDLTEAFDGHIILGQVDEFIGSINPAVAWNYLAVCH